jgi:ketosteroid isomerase-like protein
MSLARLTLPAMALAACLASCSLPAAGDGVAAVKAANEVYETALLDGDGAALGRVLTDDFVFIGWEGETMDKAEFVRGATREYDMTSSAPRDVQIRQLAPTVVQVTGIWEGDTVTDGTVDHGVERFSNIWVRSAAGWRIELEHTSPLAAPTPARNP